MLKNKAPLKAIQSILGHRSIDLTQVYTKLHPHDIIRMHNAHHPRQKFKKYKTPDFKLPEFICRKIHFRKNLKEE